MAIAAVVLFALIPPWWTDPIGGVDPVPPFEPRTASKTIPIKIQFLGTVYDTPEAVAPLVQHARLDGAGDARSDSWSLGLLGLGGGRGPATDEPIGLLIAGHWAFLMILRALPHTPGHDGVRLFLPAFGILALLGGLGARSPAGPVRAAGARRRSSRPWPRGSSASPS